MLVWLVNWLSCKKLHHPRNIVLQPPAPRHVSLPASALPAHVEGPHPAVSADEVAVDALPDGHTRPHVLQTHRTLGDDVLPRLFQPLNPWVNREYSGKVNFT